MINEGRLGLAVVLVAVFICTLVCPVRGEARQIRTRAFTDGSVEITYDNGTRRVYKPDGSRVDYFKLDDGIQEIYHLTDGRRISLMPDGLVAESNDRTKVWRHCSLGGGSFSAGETSEWTKVVHRWDGRSYYTFADGKGNIIKTGDREPPNPEDFAASTLTEREFLRYRPTGCIVVPGTPSPVVRRAFLAVAIRNVKKQTRADYCRWDFDRVFTELNGIGATLTGKELWMTFSTGDTFHNTERISVRIKGGQTVVTKGHLDIQGDIGTTPVTGTMRVVFRGRDDEGNPLSIETYFNGN